MLRRRGSRGPSCTGTAVNFRGKIPDVSLGVDCRSIEPYVMPSPAAALVLEVSVVPVPQIENM